MKFYNYKYKVKTDIDKAFNYFLQKEFLLKYFSSKELEDIKMTSEFPSAQIIEGEQIKILYNDDELEIVINSNVDKIRRNELIKYDIVFEEILDYEIEEEDEEDYDIFMKNLLG